MEIIWNTNIRGDIKLLRMFEDRLGLKFPDKYVQIVSKHDSAQPEIINENGEIKTGVVKIKYKYEKKDTFGFYSFVSEFKISDAYWLTRRIVPNQLIPFAENGGGNIYYFDYRKSSNPRILYQEHEEIVIEGNLSDEDLQIGDLEYWQDTTLFEVANSFDEFLNMIEVG